MGGIVNSLCRDVSDITLTILLHASPNKEAELTYNITLEKEKGENNLSVLNG